MRNGSVLREISYLYLFATRSAARGVDAPRGCLPARAAADRVADGPATRLTLAAVTESVLTHRHRALIY